MIDWKQFFQDSVGAYSSARLVFILGSFIILGLVILQFFGYGTLSTAIYGIMATLVSGGYVGSKYMDTLEPTTELEDMSRDSENS